jgi:hypothetical protein
MAMGVESPCMWVCGYVGKARTGQTGLIVLNLTTSRTRILTHWAHQDFEPLERQQAVDVAVEGGIAFAHFPD